MKRASVGIGSIAVLVVLGGACAAEDAQSASCGAVYPSTDAGSVVHVAASCPTETPDGSASAPYATIQAAITAAPAGATVLVAPGVYEENLVVAKALTIVGADRDAASIILKTPQTADVSVIVKIPAPEELGVVVKAPLPDAIRVEADGVTIQGISVDAPLGIGILLLGDATVTAVRVDGARPAAGGAPGQGIVATSGATVALNGVAVVGSAAEAIILQDVAATILHCLASHSGGAGLVVEGLTAGGLSLRSSIIDANTGTGVAVFGGAGIILQNNAITGTVLDAKGVGDGVHVAQLEGEAAPVVQLAEGNLVSGNARVGVMFDHVETGVIVKSEVSDNARGGIWIQGSPGAGEGVTLDGVIVKRNRFAGVTVTHTALAVVLGSTISDTLEGKAVDTTGSQVAVADGLGVFTSSAARIENNNIEGSVRAGILLDGARPDLTVVAGNNVTGNRIGIILQRPLPAGAVLLGENVAEQNPDGNVITNPAIPIGVDPAAGQGL